jgi:hypothetical protein
MIALAGFTDVTPGQCVNVAGQQVPCVTVPGRVTAFFVVFIVIMIAISLFSLVCDAKIISKAGYSGWLVLTAFVPVVNFVLFIVFAFAKWPIQSRLEEAERGRYGGGYGGGGGGGYGGGSGGGAGGYGPPPFAPGLPVPPPLGGATSASPASPAPPVATAAPADVAQNVIYCSWCGKPRAVDAQAIHHCGSMERPPAYCMNCGTPLGDGATACAACGQSAVKVSR